jgi:hypothetical protein
MARLSGGMLVGYMSIVALAGVIASYFLVTAPQRRMQRVLKELSTVEVGSTTIQSWRSRMRAAKLDPSSLTCQGGTCRFSQKVQVRALSRLRLAPASIISTYLTFNDGIASEIYVWFEIDDQRAGKTMQPGTGATVHETQQSRSCPQHYCTYVTDRGGYRWAVIEIDSAASPDDRAKAFGIDIGCLTKFGGCRSARALLPQAFGK